MTPGMQIRLWLRTAARSQVALTAAVLAAVVALLVASLPSDRAVLAPQDALGQVPGGPIGTVGGGTTAGTLPGSAGGLPAGTPGTTGSTGTLLPGATTGGTGSSTGGFTGGTAGTGATGGTTGGTTTAGTTGGSAVDISRATDRGVNSCEGVKACVKIGVYIGKLGGLDQSGFALNLRTDIREVVTAYIKDLNARGGVLGRTIVPVFRDVDPISEDDQNQACTQMVRDDKVFAVIDTAAVIFANPQKCLAQTNATPYVHGYAESEGFMDAARGMDVSTTRSLDRIAIEWADEMGKLGFLKGGEKVGILQDNCEPSNSVVDKVLIPGIKALKPASVQSYESDCSAAFAQSQPPALQQQMCIDGVTHVVLATSFVAAQTFLQSAEGSPCGSGARKYKYMASDYSLLASDRFTRNFSRSQFDGSLAISNFFAGISKTSPALERCSSVLKKNGLPGMDNSYTHADAAQMCDNLEIFANAAKAAGPDLTRVRWAAAVQQLPPYEGAWTPRSTFKPGQTSGGDLVHAMVWRADCTCYRQSGPLHVGKG